VNLAEFIDETLSEILTGIRAAQKRKSGEAIGTKFEWGKLVRSAADNTYQFHTRDFVVDFDVSVATETTKDGKAGIRVVSVGAEGGAERKSHESSRVKFAIRVQIPEDNRAR